VDFRLFGKSKPIFSMTLIFGGFGVQAILQNINIKL